MRRHGSSAAMMAVVAGMMQYGVPMQAVGASLDAIVASSKNGRSKYEPHQGAKEIAKRAARLNKESNT